MAEGCEAGDSRSRSRERLGKIAPNDWSSSSDSEENERLQKENKAPNKKQLCLSLKEKKAPRLKTVSTKSVEKLAAPNPPKNTQASTT